MHLKWKCLAKVSKFSMLLIIYGESVAARSLSTLRSNLERHLCSRGGELSRPWAVHYLWSKTTEV